MTSLGITENTCGSSVYAKSSSDATPALSIKNTTCPVAHLSLDPARH